MWTTAIRPLSFKGSVMVDIGGGVHVPLRGVLVDVYRFSIDGDGKVYFERLNQVTERTNEGGYFSFNDLQVPVKVRIVIPGSPPYTPVELTHPNSLPNLAFRISVEAEVLKAGTTEGTQFVDIYDEREEIDREWINSHPERLRVLLAGNPPIQVLIPEGNEKAITIAGIQFPDSTVPGKEFHFLRVGRVTRQEIGELADSRPEYIGKPGYMRSSNTWATLPPKPSFFPGVIDAPFGGTLHIGGHFGAEFLNKDIYYTVSAWNYSGDPDNPLAPGTQRQILDFLFNKRYILPTPALPNGKWETLNLGPFDATITDVEPPHDPTLIGTSVKVYKRPSPPNPAIEYWPFWDLIVIWNSAVAPNDLRILSLEAYEKIGGSDTNPELKKLALTSSINGHLPLHIDNRPPVPKYLPFNPADPARKFHIAEAHFLGVSESLGPSTPMGICNEMSVRVGQPSDGNESILVRYSVEDGSGNPHQHLKYYSLYAKFTPKAVPGAPDSAVVPLKPSFSGHKPISQNYDPTDPLAPIMAVSNFTSVVVPQNIDGWPPERGDPWGLPTGTCPQYALEVGLTCEVRTIDGWARLFGTAHVSRHIIIKRI